MLAAPLLSAAGVIESALFLGIPHKVCRLVGLPIWSVFLGYCASAAVVGLAAAYELRHEHGEQLPPDSPGSAGLRDARGEAR